MNKAELKRTLQKGNLVKDVQFDFDICLHEIFADSKTTNSVQFENCVFQKFEGKYFQFCGDLKFINCHMASFSLQGSTIINGIILNDCILEGYADIALCQVWNGDNCAEITKNKFFEILTFEDTNFHNKLVFEENILTIGCDLKTKKNLATSYPSESIIRMNQGKMDLSEIEEKRHWERIRNLHDSAYTTPS